MIAPHRQRGPVRTQERARPHPILSPGCSAALLGPVLTKGIKALLAKGGYALAYNVFAALSLLALLLGSLV